MAVPLLAVKTIAALAATRSCLLVYLSSFRCREGLLPTTKVVTPLHFIEVVPYHELESLPITYTVCITGH